MVIRFHWAPSWKSIGINEWFSEDHQSVFVQNVSSRCHKCCIRFNISGSFCYLCYNSANKIILYLCTLLVTVQSIIHLFNQSVIWAINHLMIISRRKAMYYSKNQPCLQSASILIVTFQSERIQAFILYNQSLII